MSSNESKAAQRITAQLGTKLWLVSPGQSESDRLIDLLDLFRRESCDSLLDQNFRQSGDVVQIGHATSWHAVTSIQNNFNAEYFEWYA